MCIHTKTKWVVYYREITCDICILSFFAVQHRAIKQHQRLPWEEDQRLPWEEDESIDLIAQNDPEDERHQHQQVFSAQESNPEGSPEEKLLKSRAVTASFLDSTFEGLDLETSLSSLVSLKNVVNCLLAFQ